MYNFLSDTVTLPTEEMLMAMSSYDPNTNEWTSGLGDCVYNDDPTVIRLQKEAAETLGKEAALFCPTGTMGNLISVMTHCERGNEFLGGMDSHIIQYEAGGAATLGSCVPQPIVQDEDGSLNLDMMRRYVKPDDYHHAQAKLVCIENPTGGKVWSLEKMNEIKKFAEERDLKVHLDGARLFNGATALGVDPKVIAAEVDSVMICLSKGLCAPVGSLLVGDAEFIGRAKKWWKMLGGGWRQGGILASAGLIALREMTQRLHEDHRQAKYLACELNLLFAEHKVNCEIDLQYVMTNMIMLPLPDNFDQAALREHMMAHGIKMNPGRIVVHKDNCSETAIRYFIDCFRGFLKEHGPVRSDVKSDKQVSSYPTNTPVQRPEIVDPCEDLEKAA